MSNYDLNNPNHIAVVFNLVIAKSWTAFERFELTRQGNAVFGAQCDRLKHNE